MKLIKKLKRNKEIRKEKKYWEAQMEFLNSKLTKELYTNDRETYDFYEGLFIISFREFMKLD